MQLWTKVVGVATGLSVLVTLLSGPQVVSWYYSDGTAEPDVEPPPQQPIASAPVETRLRIQHVEVSYTDETPYVLFIRGAEDRWLGRYRLQLVKSEPAPLRQCRAFRDHVGPRRRGSGLLSRTDPIGDRFDAAFDVGDETGALELAFYTVEWGPRPDFDWIRLQIECEGLITDPFYVDTERAIVVYD
ncbi:MAG: hypothetical protein AAGI50_11735 [Pseudomonadota bacterium]